MVGISLAAVGSALYLSIDLGPGPRDGLMTGLQQRFGWSVTPVRTAIEGTVLVVGALLGGAVGLGTVVTLWRLDRGSLSRIEGSGFTT